MITSKSKYAMRLCIAVSVMCFLSLGVANSATAEAVERHYCTQFGPFFLRFDPDKAAGVFTIKINNDLGSVVGELDGHRFDGAWHEVDSHGKIRLAFSEDWSRFDARYNLHAKPDVWHQGWVGLLAPDGRPDSFVETGQTYYCN